MLNQFSILKIFTPLIISSLIVIPFACTNKSDFNSKEKIAICQMREKDNPEFEIFLYEDHSFYIPKTSQHKQSSTGTFEVRFTRYYFNPETEDTRLCDFYFYDRLAKMLWTNKGCAKNNLDITFLN